MTLRMPWQVAGCQDKRPEHSGPTNSTELVSTISSIVAVSRVIAPLIFVLAIIFVLVWIFYWA